MKCIITVDTEADNQWKKPGTQTLKNLEYLPGFQELCARHGFTPTYLVTYEVANNLSIASVLKTWHTTGVAEVGAHLHPWTTPPLSEEDYQGVQTFPHELATDVLEQKLLALTEKITAMLGERPTSFRAGRWGLGEHMVPLLVRLGYTVDSSVTPYINWKGFKGKENGTGGPDFRGAPLKPYVVSAQDVRTVGSSGLLEVPMTIVRTGFFRKRWCRIFPETTFADLRQIYAVAKRKKLPYIQFMIHSSELMVGGSPYVKTLAQLSHLTVVLERFLSYLHDDRIEGATLSQADL